MFFEAPGVEPLFLNQEDAIDYAQGRACVRSGEIRVLDRDGAVHATDATNGRTSRTTVRDVSCHSADPVVISLNHSYARRRLRLVPGRSYSQRTPAIGQ
jgi:hypothetical protein